MNKLLAKKFLISLLDQHPSEGAPMLIDIIIDYLLFPNGDSLDVEFLSDLDKRIAELMPDNKIQAIKETRESLGCGLKEAKDYVEQRVWPVGTKQKLIESQQKYVKSVLEKIALDYNTSLD